MPGQQGVDPNLHSRSVTVPSCGGGGDESTEQAYGGGGERGKVTDHYGDIALQRNGYGNGRSDIDISNLLQHRTEGAPHELVAGNVKSGYGLGQAIDAPTIWRASDALPKGGRNGEGLLGGLLPGDQGSRRGGGIRQDRGGGGSGRRRKVPGARRPGSPFDAGVNERTVVVEFPSFEQALATYEGPAYQAAAAKLEGAVERDFRVIEGVE